ncbi:hypothetical protein F7734_34780 [Scytonema sp. UIC 10036]|uniref:hypothetical protein n=1 Tax=Scytonema sp. UIC 10036 TaxID=2304196 RepID=UPI0012DAE1FD|nr:hypothetical protein [Scytonema sp. UIC 10036]MUG97222.1 hypothetical protein [Scytonema sp. UIC 10036]
MTNFQIHAELDLRGSPLEAYGSGMLVEDFTYLVSVICHLSFSFVTTPYSLPLLLPYSYPYSYSYSTFTSVG